jgi:hypothetical protein
VTDYYEGNAKLLCVWDLDGNVLLGKEPEPEPPTLTAIQQRQAVLDGAAKAAREG